MTPLHLAAWNGNRCDKGSNRGRGLTVCCGQYGN